MTEAPAVYFCAPTRDNIRRICADISAQLYQAFYLNFTSALAQADLDELAEKTVRRPVAFPACRALSVHISLRLGAVHALT